MRLDGASSPQIAAALGITRKTAWKLVRDALAETKEVISERTEELRAIEHERIEGYIAQLRPMALAGDLGAHRALLRWHERLARLLALDLQPETSGPESPSFVIDVRLPDQREEPAIEGVWHDASPLALEASGDDED